MAGSYVTRVFVEYPKFKNFDRFFKTKIKFLREEKNLKVPICSEK